MSPADEQHLLETILAQTEHIKKLTHIADQTARQMTFAVSTIQALTTINSGLMAAMGENKAFVEALGRAAAHRDARFNGSVMTDEMITSFKASLRDLLPPHLKNLAD